MNVQEVMSPTSIVGNAAIESVNSVSGTKVFFEIKVATAKVAPYAVFVSKRISGFRYAEEAEISSRVAININQWLREVVQPNYYRHRLSWVVQVWSFRSLNLCSGTNPR